MNEEKDPHGEMTAEHIVDCDNLKVPMTTNDKLDSYVKITVKCDVKCSLAQQHTYMRLMEKSKVDEFSYGGQYTLLDSYYARTRRIGATYARLFLETEDTCQKAKDSNGNYVDLTGRFYWMGLGAMAVKTVGCMFETWQVSKASVLFGDALNMREVYESLAKGNFWLFMDIGSWHHLYNLSNTVTPDKEGNYTGYKNRFVPCIDVKGVENLCAKPKETVKNFPWATETLPIIGDLAKPTRIPGVLEKGMEYVSKIEMEMLGENRTEDIQDWQIEQMLIIAHHEQGNVLQPLIYINPFSRQVYDPTNGFCPPEFREPTKEEIESEYPGTKEYDYEHVYTQDRPNTVPFPIWLGIMRKTAWFMPGIKFVFTESCDEKLARILQVNSEAYPEYEKFYLEERYRLQVKYYAQQKTSVSSDMINEMIEKELKEGDLAQKFFEKTGEYPLQQDADVSYGNKAVDEEIERLKEAKEKVPSYLEDGLKLENYQSRMVWITAASRQFHKLYMHYPEFIKDELAGIAAHYQYDDDFSDDKTVTPLS
ncbi:MAG TPA: hypothetical protein EYG94_05115 [Campylobacterales bacterium]|nr:hypothetical protein [Campylobacterales bacterium]